MKRREFLQWIGVGGATMVVAPKVLLPKPEDITNVPGVKEVVPVINDRGKNLIIVEGNYREGKPGEDVKFLLASENYDRTGNSFPREADLVMFPDSGNVHMIINKSLNPPYNYQEEIVVRPTKRDQCIPALKDKGFMMIVGSAFMEGE